MQMKPEQQREHHRQARRRSPSRITMIHEDRDKRMPTNKQPKEPNRDPRMDPIHLFKPPGVGSHDGVA